MTRSIAFKIPFVNEKTPTLSKKEIFAFLPESIGRILNSSMFNKMQFIKSALKEYEKSGSKINVHQAIEIYERFLDILVERNFCIVSGNYYYPLPLQETPKA